MGFYRQEYCSGLPWPPPRDLPNPGIKPTFLISSPLAGRFFTATSATWRFPYPYFYLLLVMEKAMAPHSSTLAWKIPWKEEPGRLQSMVSRRVGHLLSDFTFTFHFHELKKERATHSSILAWRIPGTAEPGGLPSMGSHRVGHGWRDLAVAVTVTLPIPNVGIADGSQRDAE